MSASSLRVPLLVFLFCLLPPQECFSLEPVQSVGIAVFEDIGSRPSDLVRAERLQTTLTRTLPADYGLSAVSLQPASVELPRFPDPDTQLIPPAYRAKGWRGSRDYAIQTDWSEQGRRQRLHVVVIGAYEQFGGELRFFAEGVDPLTDRSLFSCKVNGVTSERVHLEEILAERIVTELSGPPPEVRKELSESGGPETEIPQAEEKALTAEEHYENGYALTRRYDQTKETSLLEGAAEEYRAALALDPNHFRALNNLGTVLHRLGRYEEAIEYYLKVLETSPKYVRAMENAALAYRSLGKTDKAVEMWKQALLYEDRENIRKVIQETLDSLEQKKEDWSVK